MRCFFGWPMTGDFFDYHGGIWRDMVDTDFYGKTLIASWSSIRSFREVCPKNTEMRKIYHMVLRSRFQEHCVGSSCLKE